GLLTGGGCHHAGGARFPISTGAVSVDSLIPCEVMACTVPGSVSNARNTWPESASDQMLERKFCTVGGGLKPNSLSKTLAGRVTCHTVPAIQETKSRA